jgi:hypothetical protein
MGSPKVIFEKKNVFHEKGDEISGHDGTYIQKG